MLDEFKKIMIVFDSFLFFFVRRYTDGLERDNYFKFIHKMIKLFVYLLLGFHLTASFFTYIQFATED